MAGGGRVMRRRVLPLEALVASIMRAAKLNLRARREVTRQLVRGFIERGISANGQGETRTVTVTVTRRNNLWDKLTGHLATQHRTLHLLVAE